VRIGAPAAVKLPQGSVAFATGCRTSWRASAIVEQALRAVFGRWSYEEVQTPTFERFDVIEKGLGDETDRALVSVQRSPLDDARAAARDDDADRAPRLDAHARGAACRLRLSYVGDRRSATTNSRKKAGCASSRRPASN
jgi:ATP phosphoribosyltransferase regulatory subunit HisZ